MAGLIARLLGGRPQQGPAEPVPGVGGYHLGPGPAGQSGFPGSTSQTRANLGKSPRAVKVNADTDTGFEQQLGSTTITRQAAYRGDVPGADPAGPRNTPNVTVPRRRMLEVVQDVPGTNRGGPMLHTGQGNQTAGGYINRTGAQEMGLPSADARDTTTPWVQAGQVTISGGVPGAQNVRNEIAQRYKSPPGTMHTYQSAPRADQAPVNPGGQATDGNVHPERVVQPVTVANRMVFPAEGNLSWAVLREMPYGGRGNGARGGDLNGQRRYATGQETEFWNAGQGSYGVARQRGSGPSSVSFQQPAPWSSNAYTTTASVGTADSPNQQPAQQPQAVHVSPTGRRASNRTGRSG